LELKRKIEDISDSKGLIEEVLQYFDGSRDYERLKPYDEKAPPDFEDDDLTGLVKDADGFYAYPGDQVPDSFFNIICELENRKKARLEGVRWPSAVGEKGVEPMPTLKEGNITKRKDGRWMGRYQQNGIQKTIYAATKPLIIDKVNTCVRLRDQDAEADRRGLAKKITLAEYISQWFEEWKIGRSREKALSPATIQNVQSTLIHYIGGHPLAKKPAAKVNAQDLEIMIDSIATKSMQARTFGYLYMVFERLLKRKVIKENPMDQLERRSRPAPKKKYIPDEQSFLAFLTWLKEKNAGIYYLAKFLADTGMRVGESLALTWNDIHLDIGKVTINKAYSAAAKAVLNHPKTDAGFRDAPLFQSALEVLNEVPRSKKSNEVFWFCSKWSCSKSFTKLAAEYGFAKMPIHNLRHYFASRCLTNGIDKKTYSKWMGHADIEVTLDVYSHITSDFERDQIALMAKKGHKKD